MRTFLSAFTRTRHALCALCALCAVACFAGPVHAAGEPRIALVVGNAGYEDSPLANPVNDASDMAKELKRLGFAVTLRTNQNADQLKELISDFGDQLARSKGVGLFYFAGHGVQVDGRNYLLPVGRRYRREKDVELFAVESRAVLARMEEAGNPLNIVILDACRDSPLPPESRTAGSRGLARDTAPSGALIAYATAPGRTADDRRGARNGLYTGHLLQALREPGLRLEDVFGRVRDAVERDSARQQSPEEVVKLRGQPFYFMPPLASAGSPPVLSPPPAPRPEPVAPSGPRVGDVFRDCAECPEMVVLPSGNFDMGDLHGDGESDEKPVRTVRIGQPFALGKYEVTVGAFRRFVAASGYRTDAERNAGAKGCIAWDASDGKWDWREGRDWRSPGFGQEDSHPVVCVSWNDAQAYIKWLSKESGQRYRLASEAEFEYALRAGGRTKWPWGDDATGACRHGNVADRSAKRENPGWNIHECDDGFVHTAPVGRYAKNAFGLHDMSGNVWEWVQDCYEESGYDKGQPEDGRAHEPSTNCARRVFRGGGWGNYARGTRSANRDWDSPGYRFDDLGFRLSRTLP